MASFPLAIIKKEFYDFNDRKDSKEENFLIRATI
jgi:hypothetical protein